MYTRMLPDGIHSTCFCPPQATYDLRGGSTSVLCEPSIVAQRLLASGADNQQQQHDPPPQTHCHTHTHTHTHTHVSLQTAATSIPCQSHLTRKNTLSSPQHHPRPTPTACPVSADYGTLQLTVVRANNLGCDDVCAFCTADCE
jgi:hypothetical protein